MKKIDKNCFLWSILAYLHLCENSHPSRMINYKQISNELSFDGFNFTNGFQCSDVQRFEKLNNLSIIKFELNFYQAQNKWKHILIPIEMNKDDSNRNVDLIIYKNKYVLVKKLHVFLGNRNKSFTCARCLNSYTSENMLMIHQPKCENYEITPNRTSGESNIL